uniref:Uncharacterized protein n=1 Tax=Picea glauca TaxID=3330 RepID=A0A117NJ56_PICGL|nr:hypothetical protein ABT39_MTgene822 [Picea glauca]QHR87163.1 hypothetical protein Q903MT_gene1172 [Picea sitchensis]
MNLIHKRLRIYILFTEGNRTKPLIDHFSDEARDISCCLVLMGTREGEERINSCYYGRMIRTGHHTL